MSGYPLANRPEKIAPGRYKYRGRFIIRTDWEGPRGGTKYQWELGSEDKYDGVVLDSVHLWPTMRDLVRWLDEHPEEHVTPSGDAAPAEQ